MTQLVENDSYGAFNCLKELVQTQYKYLSKTTYEELKDTSQGENECIIVIGNIFLDCENDVEQLNNMLNVYEDMNNVMTFILLGEFISPRKADTADYDDIKLDYKQLADIIKKYHRLRTQCRFIIVPGMNDPASDGIMPCMQASTMFMNIDTMEPEFINDDFSGIK